MTTGTQLNEIVLPAETQKKTKITQKKPLKKLYKHVLLSFNEAHLYSYLNKWICRLPQKQQNEYNEIAKQRKE